MEENKETKQDENTNTATETAQETPKADETDEHSMEGLIVEIKANYEKALADQKQKYEAKVKEREKVIKQLLGAEGEPKPKHSLVDDINKKRLLQKNTW